MEAILLALTEIFLPEENSLEAGANRDECHDLRNIKREHFHHMCDLTRALQTRADLTNYFQQIQRNIRVSSEHGEGALDVEYLSASHAVLVLLE